MALINLILGILILSVILILASGTRWQGIIALSAVSIIGLISGYFAVNALQGYSYETVLSGTRLFGDVPVIIDSLSAWFILTIDFTFITGAIYGFSYLKKYKDRKNDITVHSIAYLVAHFALVGICSVQNGFIFLVLWELMALSVFILVIFENNKPETIKAGINYLVQSHISIVFIMLGFIYVAFKTGSYSFDAITSYTGHISNIAGTALFLCFFIGFAIKSGFVPFHTWLPYAHPAAPAHISGVMSGVVIKIGIYGILRMLLLIKTDLTSIGYIILVISVITGIYGVMLAIIQHNLKKLLAYHSIENIGIIGIGIGIGCIGLGETNKWMAILGFSGALLHTLNHSLFKSLLFYSSGNVYQAAHTVDVERLGGLMKRMPQTAILFLVAAVAICGLPPLNGFISEFLILGGLYNWLFSAGFISLMTIIFSIGGLVFIGGLAFLCFTKAFSVVFLGNPREPHETEVSETGFWQLLPMYFAVFFMIIIGLFPSLFITALQRPVNLYTHDIIFNLNLIKVGSFDSLKIVNWLFFGMVMLVIAIVWIRRYYTRKSIITKGSTWGCGYTTPVVKAQYTASSFVRSYTKLAKPVLDIEKSEVEVKEVFPGEKHYKTESYDMLEKVLIDKPLKSIERFTDKFMFLQNGHLQNYILYGIVFITAVICIPLLYEKILFIIKFLNNL